MLFLTTTFLIKGKLKTAQVKRLCMTYLAMTTIALFPGSRAWEEKKDPGAHCLHMPKVSHRQCNSAVLPVSR